jgi:hypothetical protein
LRLAQRFSHDTRKGDAGKLDCAALQPARTCGACSIPHGVQVQATAHTGKQGETHPRSPRRDRSDAAGDGSTYSNPSGNARTYGGGGPNLRTLAQGSDAIACFERETSAYHCQNIKSPSIANVIAVRGCFQAFRQGRPNKIIIPGSRRRAARSYLAVLFVAHEIILSLYISLQ